MPRKFIPYLKWPIAALFALVPTLLVLFWPMSYWFDVRAIHVNDAHAGEMITMVVDRDVRIRFTGYYLAGIYVWTGRGFTPYCTARGKERLYKEGAEYPEPLTLRWWTDDEPTCRNLPAGQYQMSTRWVTTGNDWPLPEKSVTRESNIFTIRP